MWNRIKQKKKPIEVVTIITERPQPTYTINNPVDVNLQRHPRQWRRHPKSASETRDKHTYRDISQLRFLHLLMWSQEYSSHGDKSDCRLIARIKWMVRERNERFSALNTASLGASKPRPRSDCILADNARAVLPLPLCPFSICLSLFLFTFVQTNYARRPSNKIFEFNSNPISRGQETRVVWLMGRYFVRFRFRNK